MPAAMSTSAAHHGARPRPWARLGAVALVVLLLCSAGPLAASAATTGRAPTFSTYAEGAREHPRVGTTLLLYGERLGAVTGVTIGGLDVPFTLLDPRRIEADVPWGATSATAAVRWAGGTVTAPPLTLYPSLGTLTPTSGPVGTRVTVTGANIPVGLTYAYLSGRQVRVVRSSYARLVFVVPPDAVSGRLDIHDAKSLDAFNVTSG